MLRVLSRQVAHSHAFREIAQFACSRIQLVCLQQTNCLIYKRVRDWMEIVYRTTIRLTEMVCHNGDFIEVFVFPTKATIK